jgi:cholesterol oxidase
MFDLRLMRDITVLTAAGVGGGSLVYANVQLKAPAAVFAAGWPKAINRAELDPYYDRSEDALQPRTTPATPPLPKVAAFAAAAAVVGKSANLLPLAVHFGDDREHPFSGIHQKGCTNLGRCDFGCPRRARNTVDITYLARAERFGAEIYPLHEVTWLAAPRPGVVSSNWQVGYRDLQYHTSAIVAAPTVVLAAGCLGTTRLLLRNRKRLPKLSPALGSRFSTNGDALGIAFSPTAPGTKSAQTQYGPTMTSFIDYTDEHGFIIADAGLPGNFTGLLDIVRDIDMTTGWRRYLLRLKRAVTRFGITDQPVTHQQLRLRQSTPATDALILLNIGRDAANGKIRLSSLFRCLDVEWNPAASSSLFDHMKRTNQDLADAVGAELFFAMRAGPLNTRITVHPLGGAPMADNPALGVVDDTGKVYGYDGLYILDGSIVPTAIGVNPSKTIAALAERGVERIIAAVTCNHPFGEK